MYTQETLGMLTANTQNFIKICKKNNSKISKVREFICLEFPTPHKGKEKEGNFYTM